MYKRVLQARAQALSPHWQDQQNSIQLRTGAISSPRPAEGEEGIVQDVAVIDTSGTLSVWQTKVQAETYQRFLLLLLLLLLLFSSPSIQNLEV